MRTIFAFMGALAIFFSSAGDAAENTWKSNSILIESSSELQGQIDDIVSEIFNSPIRKNLCGVFQNPLSLRYSLGVSAGMANEIYKNCFEISSQITKVMPKKFYISLEQPGGLDSWTDYSNNTYIFADEGLTRIKLKSILIHEIAMTVDAKANMLLSDYLTYLQRQRNSIVLIPQGHLSRQQDHLRQAFLYATWEPVSRTFATLRAFNFESHVVGKPSLTSTHKACISEFKALFNTIKRIPSPNDDEAAGKMAGIFVDFFNQKFCPKSPEDEHSLLDVVLSSYLAMPDAGNSGTTFCQYMAEPLLSARSSWTFFSNGPRPRVTGGSGGQGLIISEKDLAQTSVLKDKVTEALEHFLASHHSSWKKDDR